MRAASPASTMRKISTLIFSMYAIVDTSAISHLARIGELDQLFDQFSSVLIPDAVYRELCRARVGGLGPAFAAIESGRIDVRATTSEPSLDDSLDPGEAAVLAFAIAIRRGGAGRLQGPGYVVIDEQRGRRVARAFNLSLTGTLGILAEARDRGRIPSLRAACESLRLNGFFIHPKLEAQLLAAVGE